MGIRDPLHFSNGQNFFLVNVNILMVMHRFPPEFGGATIQGIELAKALGRRGVSVEFLTDNGSRRTVHGWHQGLMVTKLRTFISENNKLRELIFSIRIALFIVTHSKCQIVHFHSMMGFELLFLPFVRLFGRKIILKLTLAGSDDPLAFKNRRKMNFLYMWGLQYVDKFVAISSLLKGNTLKAGIPERKIKQISNGVNPQKFSKVSQEEKRQLKKRLGLEGYDKLFLSVGSIEYRKGYDTLLEVWRILNDSYDSCGLVIVGPGNSPENKFFLELSSTIENWQFTNIMFVGSVDNVEDYMKVADCFVFCSRMEGLPNALIEALAIEIPVVAMNIPGITEDVILDDHLGRICFSRDPKEFSSIVLSHLEAYDPDKGRVASEKIREKFSMENISEQYVRLYYQLCPS